MVDPSNVISLILSFSANAVADMSALLENVHLLFDKANFKGSKIK